MKRDVFCRELTSLVAHLSLAYSKERLDVVAVKCCYPLIAFIFFLYISSFWKSPVFVFVVLCFCIIKSQTYWPREMNPRIAKEQISTSGFAACWQYNVLSALCSRGVSVFPHEGPCCFEHFTNRQQKTVCVWSQSEEGWNVCATNKALGESRSGLVMTEPLVKTNVQDYQVLTRWVLSEACNSAGQLCLLEQLRVLAKHLHLIADAQPLSGWVLNEAQ